ncbi:MAG: iron export ABC transporter permease subunit FetB [Rhodospirillaceae bacterium]|nr:iron export ABC transporter permease subunit FetB [Rhodospirillales bacterium]
MTYIRLELMDIALAGILVLVNGALSLALGLGIERKLLVASVRMVVQLLLVGLVLTWLFATVSPWLTLGVALVMVLFAGHEIMARQDRRLKGLWAYGLGTGCMLLAAGVVTLFALTTQLKPEPWYDPRYAIPLLGMVLGNTMTGIALGLNTLTAHVSLRRNAIEARLALGDSSHQATMPVVRQALSTALTPIINSMAATGVVSLPGMMTGQILGGVDPVEAVKYQILIMFLIAGGTGLGAVAAVMGGINRLTDHRHRVRLDRLR